MNGRDKAWNSFVSDRHWHGALDHIKTRAFDRCRVKYRPVFDASAMCVFLSSICEAQDFPGVFGSNEIRWTPRALFFIFVFSFSFCVVCCPNLLSTPFTSPQKPLSICPNGKEDEHYVMIKTNSPITGHQRKTIKKWKTVKWHRVPLSLPGVASVQICVITRQSGCNVFHFWFDLAKCCMIKREQQISLIRPDGKKKIYIYIMDRYENIAGNMFCLIFASELWPMNILWPVVISFC